MNDDKPMEIVEPSVKWIVITRNKDGKIEIFKKYTEYYDGFEHEVKGWGNTILCTYRENDVVNVCSL